MELLASGLEQRPLVTRRWKVGGADFHEYRNGLISRLRIGFNLVEASQQLGLRLAPGSRAQRVRAALQRV